MPHEVPSAEVQAAPTLEGCFDFWQQRLDRLEADMGSLAGTNQWPEWYTSEDTSPLRSIVPKLREEGADLSGVSRYYDLFSKESELRATLTGNEPYTRPLQQVITNLGEDLAARGFVAEASDGSLHTAMLADLEKESDAKSGVLTPELTVLKQVYGTGSLTELLGIGGDEYSDKLRGALLQPSPVKWMRHNEEVRDPEFKWHDTQEAIRTWMSKAVEAATGMPAAEASDYVFSASRNGDSDNEHTLDIIHKMNSFGLDRVRQLAAFSGIHGLEAYTTEQLERMEALANDPTSVAERLAEHDVTAVMINRFGDHNGVLRNVAADFDDNGRTLFFEITTMDDIYRRMVTLRKAGVQPSSLILAAHSAPVQFMVSDVREKDKALQRRDIATTAGRKLVAMANGISELDPGDFGYSMHGMKGMARLVETYMRPSRAIDDADSDAGRKKIIFAACHAASEAKMSDVDEQGEKYQIGMESVISQLGKDLIASGVQTNVDIYGAPGGIQMHRSEKGVHYSGQPTPFDEAMIARPHLAAERVRVEDGKFSKQEVQDIPLRK